MLSPEPSVPGSCAGVGRGGHGGPYKQPSSRWQRAGWRPGWRPGEWASWTPAAPVFQSSHPQGPHRRMRPLSALHHPHSWLPRLPSRCWFTGRCRLGMGRVGRGGESLPATCQDRRPCAGRAGSGPLRALCGPTGPCQLGSHGSPCSSAQESEAPPSPTLSHLPLLAAHEQNPKGPEAGSLPCPPCPTLPLQSPGTGWAPLTVPSQRHSGTPEALCGLPDALGLWCRQAGCPALSRAPLPSCPVCSQALACL